MQLNQQTQPFSAYVSHISSRLSTASICRLLLQVRMTTANGGSGSPDQPTYYRYITLCNFCNKIRRFLVNRSGKTTIKNKMFQQVTLTETPNPN